MITWRLALALVIVMLLPAAAQAAPYTCDLTGCTWSTAYTEPSKLSNGQSITDLTGCTITYTTLVDGVLQPGVRSYIIPASKPTGGGVIAVNHLDPTMLPGHTYTITGATTCTSTSFGVSAPSASTTFPMNNGVAPNPTAAPVFQ